MYSTEQQILQLETVHDSRPESVLATRILMVLKEYPMGKTQIARKLGHQSVSSGLYKQLKYLLGSHLIELTLPETPNSRLQKYR